MKKKMISIITVVSLLSLTACGNTTNSTVKKDTFTPRLDTQQTDTLEIAGFMGNFEALDQAINAFNEIYPNVTFLYDHNTSYMLPEYLTNNAGTDIFMTADANITRTDLADYNVQDWCLDLSKEELDTSSVLSDALKECTVDNKILRIPIAMNPCGIVVNKTLLKDEGLEVPANYSEFLDVMAALKDKGYTPLQGSQRFLYGELAVNMAMNILNDSTALENLLAGKEEAVTTILPAFERLETIIKEGYTDYELNCTYPEDNYDGSIMAFFEGQMPFYVCNSECVSGMKKRESKSESYSAEPFEYEFEYVPLGDEGAYAYTEPWYGFSVNKNSDSKELALEFIRFLLVSDRLDSMASIKGMPSAAVNGTNERYEGMTKAKNIQASFSNDGSVPGEVREIFEQVCNDYGAGTYADAKAAAEAFVQQCAGISHK